MPDKSKFVEGEDFQDWFNKNEDLLHEMIRSDAYELLWEAWFAGYTVGLDRMANLTCGIVAPPSIPVERHAMLDDTQD